MRATHLVVAFAVALLLAPGVAGQEPPRHVDHDRAEASIETLLMTAQGMVDAGANGLSIMLEDEAGEDRVQAFEQVERGVELGGFLQEAGHVEARNVTMEPVLDVLGPAGAELAPGVANLTRDGYALFHEEDGGVLFTVAWLNVRDDLPRVWAHMESLEEEGVDTEGLAIALGVFEERFSLLEPPAESGVRVHPSPVFYGDRVTVTVFHPDAARDEGVASLFGDEHTVALDEDGIGEASMRAPWSVDMGVHAGNVSFPQDKVLALEVLVERVPTAWTSPRAGPPGEDRSWQAGLIDHDRDGVAGANVTVQLLGEGARDSVNVSTRADGRVVVGLDAGVEEVLASFEGNRTHAASEVAWEDAWEPPRDEEDESGIDFAELFGRVGVSEPPEAPEERLITAVLVVLASLAVLALELEQFLWRQRWGGLGAWVGKEEPVAGLGGVLDSEHPVVRALSAAGYDPDRLTLREAVEICEALGAPAVRDWAMRHEAAYYGEGSPPPVPGELRWWAQGMR